MSSVNIVDPSSGICWPNKSIITYIMNTINTTIVESCPTPYDKNYFIDELFRRLVEAYDSKNTYLINKYLCLERPIMGKCPALYFVVYHQHFGLTNYVLSKIEAVDISQPVFRLACEYENMDIIQALCEKDPVRFYITTNKKGETVGKIRSVKQRAEFLKV